jgi:hypothetical protein
MTPVNFDLCVHTHSCFVRLCLRRARKADLCLRVSAHIQHVIAHSLRRKHVTVLADARPPHSLHSLLRRWCWEMSVPQHSVASVPSALLRYRGVIVPNLRLLCRPQSALPLQCASVPWPHGFPRARQPPGFCQPHPCPRTFTPPAFESAPRPPTTSPPLETSSVLMMMINGSSPRPLHCAEIRPRWPGLPQAQRRRALRIISA